MDRRVDILLLIDEASLGGGQQHVLWLAEGLAHRHFTVHVGTAPEGYLVEALRARGIPVHPVAFPKAFDPGGLRDAHRLLSRLTPAILHTHGGTAGFYGRSAALRHAQTRVVHTFHGIHYLHSPDWRKRFIQSAIDRMLARHTDRTICVAESDRELALRHRLARREDSVVIRNGIDLSRFAGIGRRRAPGKRPMIGTIGRMHVQKGQRHFLEAAAAILRTHPHARFRIIGDGELRETLERLRQDLGLNDRVEFSGERADAAAELARMDVFLLPSLWEGLPYVLLEAMAAGVPVVATAVDGNKELITHGMNGLLVPAADPEAMAGAALSLLDDPARRRILIDGGKRTVRDSFDLDAMVERTVDVYRELLR